MYFTDDSPFLTENYASENFFGAFSFYQTGSEFGGNVDNSQNKEILDELFPVFVKYIIAKRSAVLYNTGRYGSVSFQNQKKIHNEGDRNV